jgi:hypothetical protein
VLGGAILSALALTGLYFTPKQRTSSPLAGTISTRQYFQVSLMLVASLVVWNTELNLQQGFGLPILNAFVSYVLLAFSCWSFLFVPKSTYYDLV